MTGGGRPVRLMRQTGLALAAAFALAACGAGQKPDADPAELAAVSYRDPGPASLTLYTMVNNNSGQGGHSALMVNGPERVIFDPAGSFHADIVPEVDDVLFGITPRVEQAYRSAHARNAYHVVSQTVEVTPEQAAAAYRLVRANGAVPGAFCANATSGILRQVPGFEDLNSTFYPVKLSDQFAQLPGVVTSKYYENDDGDITDGVARSNAELNG